MNRFLIFPPLLTVWFFAAQFGLMVLSRVGTYTALYLFPLKTDVYIVTSRVSPFFFTPTIGIGAVMGCIFATLDFALYRNRRTPKETLSQLLPEGIKSGIIAVALVLLCQGIFLVFTAQQNHRRYHAYQPDIAWLNLIHTIQPLLLLASVLWAIGKTLRPSNFRNGECD